MFFIYFGNVPNTATDNSSPRNSQKKQSNLIKFVTKLANFNFNLVLLNLSVSKFLFGLVIVVFMAIKLV